VSTPAPERETLREQLRAALRGGVTERELVTLYRDEADRLAGGSKLRAARLLGVDRRTVYGREKRETTGCPRRALRLTPAALAPALAVPPPFRLRIHPTDRRECPDLPPHFEWFPTEADVRQAFTNHRQTFEQLDSRGGLSWDELAAVLQGRGYLPVPVRLAADICSKVLAARAAASAEAARP
jgi:hypothetical protein